MNPDEIRIGNLYSLRTKDSTFWVAKILDVDELGFYVRVFGNVFEQRPVEGDISRLTMERIDPRCWPIGCFPILKSGFLADDPVLLGHVPLTEDEYESLNDVFEAQSEGG